MHITKFGFLFIIAFDPYGAAARIGPNPCTLSAGFLCLDAPNYRASGTHCLLTLASLCFVLEGWPPRRLPVPVHASLGIGRVTQVTVILVKSTAISEKVVVALTQVSITFIIIQSTVSRQVLNVTSFVLLRAGVRVVSRCHWIGVACTGRLIRSAEFCFDDNPMLVLPQPSPCGM